MSRPPVQRRSRITHRPRLEVQPPQDGLGRFVQEQLIKLLVISLPIAGLVIYFNGSLAHWTEINRREALRFQQENENARQKNRLWGELHDELADLTVELTNAALSVASSSGRVGVPEPTDSRMGAFLEVEQRLEQTLMRIRGYGRRDRDDQKLDSQISRVARSRVSVRQVLVRQRMGSMAVETLEGASPYDEADAVRLYGALGEFDWDARELRAMLLDLEYVPVPYSPLNSDSP